MKCKNRYILIISLILSFLWMPQLSSAQNMIDYTAYPTFVTSTIAPNILLVLDQSGGMQFPAYTGCQFNGYSSKIADCGTSDSASEPEYSYDPSKDYYGYFKTDKYYQYGSNKFEENASCADTDKIGSSNCISGNLLNWSTMSRIDLMRKALIGGKAASTQLTTHTLRGEGSRYIYSDDNLSCTFTISGGSYPNLAHVITISDYDGGTCQVGSITDANIKVDLPDKERRGIIQNLSDQDYDGTWDADAPRFGLMVFSGDNRSGEMMVGIEGANMSSFLTALQGEPPYSGTPTGEALEEAYDYFVQINDHPHEANSAYIGGQGSTKDPMCDNGTPVGCRKNFVLLISDGEWNDGYIDPVIPARENYVNDIRTDIDGVQNIITYALYTSFSNSSVRGRNSLQQVAMYGGFEDFDSNTWPYNRSGYPSDSRDVTLPASPCDPLSSMNDSCKEWDKTGANGKPDGIPDNYFEASDGNELESQLMNAIAEMLKRASSGTAVSVLATTGDGEGAVYQAFFYPKKLENFESRNWIGYIQALFVDKYGNLREDSNNNNALDLTVDSILEMSYTPEDGSKITKCSDSDGDGKIDSCSATPSTLDDIQPIWKGDKVLWSTDPAMRTIYTSIDGYTPLEFTVANSNALSPYLRGADSSETNNIVNWIRGDDLTGITDAGHPNGYRKRSITIDNVTNVWKLGDIIYSTPTVVGRPLEHFDLLYGDETYSNFRLAHLKRRHVVYTGANDGMLHAFNGGCFDADSHKFFSDVDGSGNCTSGSHLLGEELWAFIPRGLLPHLTWLTDPDYTHVYYVDSKPKVTDVQIFNPDNDHIDGWGTILIGGFRYGGKDISWTSDSIDYSASPEYFALDITDPLDPQLLWTFTDPDLGLSMSFPSVAKIGSDWYVTFGSGATDYDTNSNLTAFQNGNLFVLKISGGNNGLINTWTENSNFWKKTTGNTNTFMSDSISVDVDINYDVDVIYIGENYLQGGSWNALLHRITTDKGAQADPSLWSLSTLADINNIAGKNDVAKKITGAPSAAMDNMANLWVFFGTGQFLGTSDKNQTDTGAFYGIKDGCWNGSCNTPFSNLLDISAATVDIDGSVSGVSGACGGAVSSWSDLLSASRSCDGWSMYFSSLGEGIDYNGDSLIHNGERVLTKPLVLGGLVTWASYIPGIDECSYEGESNVYAVYYETGTAYKKYVFSDQKEQATPSTTVARTKHLGKGMPSSLSGQITSSGTAKGFVQQSTGTILEIQSITPNSLKSGTTGWKTEAIP